MENDLPSTAARIFVAGQIERRSELSRADFVRVFEGRTPVVVEGCGGEALARWDPRYLVDTVGQARLELLDGVYSARARQQGFVRPRKVACTLEEFVQSLLRGESDRGYLFNTESSVFRTNPDAPQFAVGWGRAPNPALVPLARDLALPDWVAPESLVYAGLLLGGVAHTAPLHYDLGGEAKALIQIRGRKRVLLFPPSEAGRLYFPSWFEESPPPFRVPHATEVDLEAPDFERFPALAAARGVEAVLAPGDALYWPPFWSHHVRNQDPFTLAATVTLEELHATPMHLREVAGLMSRLFLRVAEQRSLDLSSKAGVLEALRAAEAELFSEANRGRTSMWGWHHALS